MIFAALPRFATQSSASSGVGAAAARAAAWTTTRPRRCELPATQPRISSGLPTVAERPMRWRSWPQRRASRSSTRDQVPAAIVADERMDLIDDDRTQPGNSRPAGTFRLISMTSSDSGVVRSRSAGSP